jgi:Domain of unknown function (DUF4956)
MNIFNWEFYDLDKIGNLVVRFLIDFSLTLIVVQGVYARRDRNDVFVFTFFIFNLLVFFVTYIMMSITMDLMGFGFGLFALFSILRYRTTAVKIREMTYLFTVLTIGIIHALPATSFTVTELLFVDFCIVSCLFLFEVVLARNVLNSLEIRYEKIELVTPARYPELLEDLKKRTGLDIVRFRVEGTNFINDSATIVVFFRPDSNIYPPR